MTFASPTGGARRRGLKRAEARSSSDRCDCPALDNPTQLRPKWLPFPPPMAPSHLPTRPLAHLTSRLRAAPGSLAALVSFVLPLLLLASCGMGWQRQFPVGADLYAKADGRHYGRVLAFEDAHDFANGMGAQPSVLVELDGPADEPGRPRQLWAACDALSAFYEVGPKKEPAPTSR